MKSSEGAASKSYLFNVDLLIDGESNAKALENLLRLLNDASVGDYRIHAGRQMGKLIKQAEEDAAGLMPFHIPQKLETKASAKAESKAETKQAAKAETKPEAKATGNSPDTKNDSKNEAKAEAKKAAAPKSNNEDLAFARIKDYIAANKLIRLAVNKGRGVKLSVPCRILTYDESGYSVTVYHVDEKQVYTFSLNEIDDFQE